MTNAMPIRDDLAALLRSCRPLSDVFAAADRRLFLVGGVVRDHLRGLPLASLDDVDLTTDAPPGQIKSLVSPLATAVWTQGERFGTIGARIDDVSYEITTHRADQYDEESRKPVVAFGDRIEDDLARRDFTINAMARRLPAGDLVDPFDGATDLAELRLDTPLDPEVSFSDDPLRMLRAARFVARLNAAATPRVEAAISTMLDRLDIVAIERIRLELVKLLETADPTPGLDLMRRTGLDAVVLPELGGVDVAKLIALVPDAEVRLSFMWSDRSPDAVVTAARRLKMSNDEIASAKAVAKALTTVTTGDASSAETTRRFAYAAGSTIDRALAVLAACDEERAATVQTTLAALDEDLTDWSPPLDGEAIMALLDVEPGPQIGRATNHLLQHRLAHGPTTPDEARDLLRAWRTSEG